MVYHVEHGQTKMDAAGLAQGLLAEELTERGKSQAAAAGRSLRGKGIEVIYSSPMARAKQTAQIIADAIGAQVVVRPSLRPVDIGSLAGKPESTVRKYREFFASRPTLCFPDGEQFGKWYEQIRKEWLKQLGSGKRSAVVSHSIDRHLLKHWQRCGVGTGPAGINFAEPLGGPVAKVCMRGNALTVRAI